MKKSLIALAAVAAVGAASAQSTVNIGGTYSFGFQKNDVGAKSADFFDAKVNFSGTEDLGGGLKASFSTEMQMGGRANLTPVGTSKVPATTKDSNVWGRNATVSLAGGFGTVTGGRIENSNTHEGAKVAGASLSNGFDQTALAGAVSNFNIVSYTSPELVPGLRASVSQTKSLNDKFAPVAVTVTATTGANTVVAAAANAETTINIIGATYVAGPVAAGFAYKMVDAVNSVEGKKTELFVTYDLGVAKLGLGYGKNSGALYAGQKPSVILSAVAPIAPNFTIGADYITRKAGGGSVAGSATTPVAGVATGGTGIDGKGYAVAANYALSKRTKFNVTVGKLEGTGLGGESQYRAGIFHTF